MALFGKQMQPTQPMSDAEQMAQIMQGNLSGQLTGGDKLLALSSLLRSVSRGRTQTPDQVFQNIQQQKLQEVQGRLQIDQLRKQAEQKAQMDAAKAQYVAQLEQTNPQLARAVQLMSADDFAKLVIEQNKPQGLGQWSEGLGRFIPKDVPVPTRSGRVNGKRVDQYSDGSTRVYEANGSFTTYDVQGNPVNA